MPSDFSASPEQLALKKKNVSILDSSIAYIDTETAPDNAPAVILLHGNPTSSFLYRNIIPRISSVARCIAPDLIGFGDSGKMPSKSYTFLDQVTYLDAFFDKVVPAPQRIFLVVQDWGSAIGFNWAMRHEKRIAGLAFMEFIGPISSWDTFPAGFRDIFQGFRMPEVGRQMIIDNNMFIEQVLPAGISRKLSEEEMNEYRRPFIDPKDREPIHRFPNELPIGGTPEAVVQVAKKYHEWLLNTDVPKIMFWGKPGGFINDELAKWYEEKLKNVKVVCIGAGIHYLQEDNPELIGDEVRDLIEKVR